ncbi:MAG: AMP-binding protein [Acidobacteria bacterium]|nr:AMP-binding protein [Acidobacteriota bacterium]
MRFDSIPALLRAQADAAPDAPALSAPGRPVMTYAGLWGQAQTIVQALNLFGVGRNDRVGVVLANGPEMASAFVSVACGATCAPLNPAYRQEEFEFYLSDLSARALIVAAGDDSPAGAAADKLGIPVLALQSDPAKPAGWFGLQGTDQLGTNKGGLADSTDVALVLHTSGTTARPKIVPLTHANVCASAANIAETLRLEPGDRCLNIMPLFHIHGLLGALMSTLAAGAEIACTPGFNVMRFFGWLDETEPTWYSAVPTMHQAIVARAPRNEESVARARLRLIRSSSAALPPQVLEELEGTFHCPVVESYGMTEASHQMASNPLPPRVRKPGSVGPAAGPEIAIMDDAGNLLGEGKTGEVVIRGANVTAGYDRNPEANAKAFTDGWFRTGDQGVLDHDGYLTITGRLKEIINRGGEKISPREIDEVLLDHPSVQQAVTFAMPHDKLGEEVAAAIVLREGAEATEKEIREFASTRLADFKVPRKVLFLAEIPKGPTGKMQRIGLAEKLGLGA